MIDGDVSNLLPGHDDLQGQRFYVDQGAVLAGTSCGGLNDEALGKCLMGVTQRFFPNLWIVSHQII